jgi:hypothetical protein
MAMLKSLFHLTRSKATFLVMMRFAGRFRTAKGGGVTLHYARALDGDLSVPVMLERCRDQLAIVSRQFGFSLGETVEVILFANLSDMQRIIGDVGGRAIPRINAVVLSAAGYTDVMDDPHRRRRHTLAMTSGGCTDEILRHEFAHLFSARWNQSAPSLLNEGLSTWIQEAWWGESIDAVARKLLPNIRWDLPMLLDHSFFFHKIRTDAAYVLAGSFTGYLIRHHGWEHYGDFYRRCLCSTFQDDFEEHFGINMGAAELQWRSEISRRGLRGSQRNW